MPDAMARYGVLMTTLHVILGSTRDTRAGERVAAWVLRHAQAHGGFDVELIDLRDWPLPMFQEHLGTIGDITDPTYSEPIVKQWNAKLSGADAFLVVTAEYLHSIPGVLKNAMDSIFLSYAFRNKPLGAVGYSVAAAGGARAVEQLMLIAIECEAAPLRNTVLIPHVGAAFDEAGNPRDPMTTAALTITLDDLAWWSGALGTARAAGSLPPGNARIRAAMARLAAATP